MKHLIQTSRSLKAGALVAVVLMSLTACNQDRAIAVRNMNEGLNDNNAGRTGDAVKKLKEAITADATYADPAYYLGQIYHQKYNQLNEAQSAFKTALERDPDNAQFHYRLGDVLASDNKHEEAMRHFKKAVEKEKGFAKAWFRLGLSQRELNQYEDAVNSFTQAIKLDPTMRIGKSDPGGAAFHALGDLYVLFRFYDKALAVYKEGVRLNPDVGQLLRGQGLAELKLEQYAEAEASLTKALKADPTKAQASFNLAVAQHKQGNTKQAIKTIDSFLSRADPIRDGARMGAANALKGELEAALEKK